MFKKILFLACLYPALSMAGGSLGATPTINESMSATTDSIPGGWTLYRTSFNRDDYYVFNQAMEGLVGASYTPFALSTSVSSGTNYKFICNAQSTYPGAVPYAVVIDIYQPLNGEPELVSINDI
jgi:hypothetical protein